MLARRAGAEGVRLSFVIKFSRQLGEGATTEAAAAELIVPATAASKLKYALAAVHPPHSQPRAGTPPCTDLSLLRGSSPTRTPPSPRLSCVPP